jgi:hypothetical protein
MTKTFFTLLSGAAEIVDASANSTSSNDRHNVDRFIS